MKRKPTIQVEDSSGNIFADLGFPNPGLEQLKAELKLQIYRIMKDRRFVELLAALDRDVEITVRPKRKEHGEVSVVVS
ncbi:MAG TPA: hypothetical protein VGY99_09425 [Candidatus Binataceae bacterium]|jgi:hypothetical protein|nr:hypothetical protein [Candidatus Binataceae bacterium]